MIGAAPDVYACVRREVLGDDGTRESGEEGLSEGRTAGAGHEDGDSRPYVGTRCGDRKEKHPPKCGALVCPSILAAVSVSGRRAKPTRERSTPRAALPRIALRHS